MAGRRPVRTTRPAPDPPHLPALIADVVSPTVHMHKTKEGRLVRPRKERRCREFEGDRVFKPRSIPMSALSKVRLGLDELEAVRLCDLEDLGQAAAGERMGVSRGTVQRLLKSGRRKLAGAIVGNAALLIGA